MQNIADALATAGRPVDEEELASFLLAGLGPDYSSLVGAIDLLKTTITARVIFSSHVPR